MARLACVQTSVDFNQPEKNRDRLIAALHDLRQDQVELTVFPEAYLTGYVVDSPDKAKQVAIAGPGANPEMFDPVRQAVDKTGVGCVFGFAEADGDTLYNTAVLLEPGQAPRTYRKTHLPYLGYDRYAKGGDELPVFETRIGRVGLQICYDLRMPEATRVQALAGAEVILLPTNWPVGAEINPELYMRSRAAENRVYILSANRVGQENGTRFIGRSSVVDMGGNVLQEAGADV
ncbi:MAG: carbon-nitrogen hydrolase family protein, partial [Fimbriimonadaceae bacterium]